MIASVAGKHGIRPVCDRPFGFLRKQCWIDDDRSDNQQKENDKKEEELLIHDESSLLVKSCNVLDADFTLEQSNCLLELHSQHVIFTREIDLSFV